MFRKVDTGNAGPDLWTDGKGRALWGDGSPVKAEDLAGEDGDLLGGIIAQEGLRIEPGRQRADGPRLEEQPQLSLLAYEAACVLRAMREAGWNAARAGKLLCVSKSTMYRLLARHRLTSLGRLPMKSKEDAQG